jgi:hypothetical protein
MKICPVGAELFHVDGRTVKQTDMKKLRVTFRNFANAPKSDPSFCSCIPYSSLSADLLAVQTSQYSGRTWSNSIWLFIPDPKRVAFLPTVIATTGIKVFQA